MGKAYLRVAPTMEAAIQETINERVIARGPKGGLRFVPSPVGSPPHRRSGILKGSVNVTATPLGISIRTIAYGAAHEFGKGNRRRPFVRPVILEDRLVWQDMIAREVVRIDKQKDRRRGRRQRRRPIRR